MIYVDANVFLRHLTQPTSAATHALAAEATNLFRQVEAGVLEITTTEVVLHEVIYALISKKHYGLDPRLAAELVLPLLRLPGFKLPRGDKTVYEVALDLMASHPQLGFADSVLAARSSRAGVPLATFDRHFDRLDGIQRWRFTESTEANR